MDFDFTVIAIVFTLVLLLVFFSAVVLYLAFRVKETFRKETRRGANIAKTAFLIGTLFLAGGIMYFSATTLSNLQQNQPTPTATSSPGLTATPNPSNPTQTASPTPAPGTTITPTPNPSQQTSPTATPNPSQQTTPTPTVPVVATFSVFFTPSPVERTTPVNMTISIVNPSSHSLQNAVIQGSVLFTYFTSTDSRIFGGTISLGQLPPGTSVYSLQLQATKIGQVDDTLSLTYQNIQSPITQQISLRIIGK
jgi:hypothetical protein